MICYQTSDSWIITINSCRPTLRGASNYRRAVRKIQLSTSMKFTFPFPLLFSAYGITDYYSSVAGFGSRVPATHKLGASSLTSSGHNVTRDFSSFLPAVNSDKLSRQADDSCRKSAVDSEDIRKGMIHTFNCNGSSIKLSVFLFAIAITSLVGLK